jgi:PhnB protein
MAVITTTHLNFRGAAREALDFYRSVFGGRTVAVTYKDAGNVQNESEADWVMWGEVEERATVRRATPVRRA